MSSLDDFRYYDNTLTSSKYLSIREALGELTCKMPAYAEKYRRDGDPKGKLRNGIYQSIHQSFKAKIDNITLGGHDDIAKTFDHIYSPTLSATFLLEKWDEFGVEDHLETPEIDHILTSWFWYHSHGIYVPRKLNSKLSSYANDLLQKDKYNELLREGIAKECARFVLPLATPTRIYMSGSVRSWVHYIDLRSGHGTQKEHMDIANACKTIFTEQFPTVSEALDWV